MLAQTTATSSTAAANATTVIATTAATCSGQLVGPFHSHVELRSCCHCCYFTACALVLVPLDAMTAAQGFASGHSKFK